MYHADCLDVLKELPDGVVDCVVTDPPYGIKKSAAFVRSHCTVINNGEGRFNEGFSWRWLEDCDYLKKGGNVASFTKREDVLPTTIKEWNRYYIIKPTAPPTPRKTFVSMVEQCLIGTKPGATKDWNGTGWEPNYWRGRVPKQRNDGTETGHPAEKPIEVIKDLTRCLSLNGALVLDPFLGSGTTGVACVQLDRQFIGIEIDAEYFTVAQKRIEAELNRMPLFAEQDAETKQKTLV